MIESKFIFNNRKNKDSVTSDYQGTYYNADIDVAVEIQIIKDVLKESNKHLRHMYKGDGKTPLRFSLVQRGRRGKKNPHPYFIDNNLVGHTDGHCPHSVGHRVDIYIRKIIDDDTFEVMKMSPKDYKDMMAAINMMYDEIIKEINRRICINVDKSDLEKIRKHMLNELNKRGVINDVEFV